jgi:hypothetical protein
VSAAFFVLTHLESAELGLNRFPGLVGKKLGPFGQIGYQLAMTEQPDKISVI